MLVQLGCKKELVLVTRNNTITVSVVSMSNKIRESHLLTVIRGASGPRDSVIWFRINGRGCSLSIVSWGRKAVQIRYTVLQHAHSSGTQSRSCILQRSQTNHQVFVTIGTLDP